MKRILAGLLAGAAILGLSACSSKGTSDTLDISDLPDTVAGEEVNLPENQPAYRRTSYQYEDGELTCKYYDDFDEHDNLIRSEKNGDPENLQMTEVYCYKYDENGNITAKTKSYVDPPSTDKKCHFYDRFYYYPDGTLKYHVDYMEGSDSGRWRKNYCKEYDSHGNEILYLSYDADGSVDYRSETKCEYDSSGALVKETWQGDGQLQVTEYTYDDAGNVLTEVRTESSEESSQSFVYTTEYAYDSRGNLIKETDTDPQNKTVSTECAYDDMNRLIKKAVVSTRTTEKHYTYRYEYEDYQS